MKEVELWDKTIGSILDDLARDNPDGLAVAYNDLPYRRTWKEFNEECDRVARGLMDLGVGKGDHVAIWATNLPEWLLTFYATVKLGGVLVTVNTAYKVFELEYLLRQSDTKVLVMGEGYRQTKYADIVNELCPDLKNQKAERLQLPMLPCLRNIIYVGQREDTPAGMLNFAELYERAENTPREVYRALTDSLTSDEVINMQYTSGTTGFPKGVMLTHKSILNNGRFIGDSMKLYQGRPPVHHRAPLPLLWHGAGHDGLHLPRHGHDPGRLFPGREGDAHLAGSEMHRRAWGAHHVYRHAGASRTLKIITSACAPASWPAPPAPSRPMQDVIDQMNMRDITIVLWPDRGLPRLHR